MRRVVVIVGACLGTVLLAATVYVNLEGDAAERYGRERYHYREVLKAQIGAAGKTRPGVVWLGDSTMLGLRGISYPQLLQGVLPHVSAAVLGYVGSDFYTYYPVVGALLAVHRPAVIVTVAHLRLFAPPRHDPTAPSGTRNDLASMIPATALPSALRLPFAARGLTIPRLLLARLLRYDAIERALYVLDGAHARVAEPARSVEAAFDGGPRRALRIALGASDVPVGAEQPTVRMMAATVRLARGQGVHVIVVGTPIPFEAMRDTVGYDPAVYRARFAVLRTAVEDAGGVFVDLHEALPAAMFQDTVGHFTRDGAEVIAARLRPEVTRELKASQWERWMRNRPARD